MTTLEITPQEASTQEISDLEATPSTDEIITTAEGFTNLNLSENLLKALSDMGFTAPSGIQAAAIPQIMMGIDIIAKAPTGSGKTAAFAIPILEKLDLNSGNKNIQALVLCPTRELAMQVHREFEKLSKYEDSVSVVSVYGGQQIEKQLSALKKRPQIIVATPGRLMDHLRRGSINLNALSMVVLDEADEMLDMGFREDIHTILEDTPENRQTILFSATMAKDIVAITKKFQKSPNIVDVTDNLQNTPNIEQLYFEVTEKDKIELLTRLLDLHNVKLALVFCNTKSNVDKVVEILKTRGYLSDSLHGDMNQAQREKVMRGFRNGGVEILVATDVAGRGIDVKNVEAVFNYDLPRDDEDYIHRIGRTARAGKEGKALTFVSKKQVQSIRRIERANGVLIKKKEVPTFEEIELARTSSYENKIKDIIQSEDLSEYVAKIEAMLNNEISAVEVAATLLKLSMNKASKRINKNIVFETASDEEGESRSRRSRGSRDRNRSGFGGSRDRGSRGGRGSRDFSRPSNGRFEDRNEGSNFEGSSERNSERGYGRNNDRDRFRNSDKKSQKKDGKKGGFTLDEMIQSVKSLSANEKKSKRNSGLIESEDSFISSEQPKKKSYNKDFGGKKFGGKKFGEKKFGSFAKRERSGSKKK